MMDELELAEAVAEGAAFMDAIDKGLPEAERWYWVVDPTKLDLRLGVRDVSGCGCVMAQHSPDGIFDPDEYNLGCEASALGFDASVAGSYYQRLSLNVVNVDEYPVLTALWIEQIDDRRAAYFDRQPEAVLS